VTNIKSLSKPYLRNSKLKEGKEVVDTKSSYEKIFQRADRDGDIRLSRQELQRFLSFLFSCRPSPTPTASAEECNTESARLAESVFDFNTLPNPFLGLGKPLSGVFLKKHILTLGSDFAV
jgi:hypothetical protein